MPVQRSILVFEYLLADPAAWKSASESMRHEAASMLSALVQDLQQLDDIRPVVLIAAGAVCRIASMGCWDSRTEILTSDRCPAEWLASPTRDPSAFAASLVIAPECDGVLATFLQQLQSGEWSQVASLNVPWTMAKIFADKFQTSRWLHERGISTPETKSIDHAAAEMLRQQSVERLRKSDGMQNDVDWCIIKPRDGVGSDRVFRVLLDHDQFRSQRQFCGPEDAWIVQPFVSGIACSVGLIGGGSEHATQILPVGQQTIVDDGFQLQYNGGQIPCAADLQPAVLRVAETLAVALGPFSGYLGADLVVGRDGCGNSVAHVIEINPRLCTSYVGYRALADVNLAGVLIQRNPGVPLRWKPMTVRFDSAGDVIFV